MSSVRLHIRPCLTECVLYDLSALKNLKRASSIYLLVSNGNPLTKPRLQDFPSLWRSGKLSKGRLRQCQQHHGCRGKRWKHGSEGQASLSR
jgi:hypothetical protein